MGLVLNRNSFKDCLVHTSDIRNITKDNFSSELG